MSTVNVNNSEEKGPSIGGSGSVYVEMKNIDKPDIEGQKLNISEPDEEEFTKGTFFVNLWKGLSWFLLMGMGIFIWQEKNKEIK